MTVPNALFVRIRNSEGKYLGGKPPKVEFVEDINKAIIFDCRREGLQIEQLGLPEGMALEAVPVEATEIRETCDRCGRPALSAQMFFDGEHYLCRECKSGGF